MGVGGFVVLGLKVWGLGVEWFLGLRGLSFGV